MDTTILLPPETAFKSATLYDDLLYGLFARDEQYRYSNGYDAEFDDYGLYIHSGETANYSFAEYHYSSEAEREADIQKIATWTGKQLIEI